MAREELPSARLPESMNTMNLVEDKPQLNSSHRAGDELSSGDGQDAEELPGRPCLMAGRTRHVLAALRFSVTSKAA